ncbi:MAG: tRNA (guanine(10)-N(2))-dimethyltransferase [Thermoplasmata archaeon]|nr:tRNA (guanine(10)-N(2))-dimethyltransferase [Thermoplasmata archaeon]
MEVKAKEPEAKCITEGGTRLLIPEYREVKGPSNSKMKVFYNPVMSVNRDFSVLFFSTTREIKRALDGLAASGANGIRIKHETEYPGEMHLNDRNPDAVEVMKRNALLNNVGIKIHRENLNTLLAQNYYDHIDIDPFGSPVEFVSQAFQAIRNRGILAITATDTGALCGSYPKACLRRYGLRNRRGPLTHETGLRGLLGYLVRQAALHDRYIEPIFSQSINHYYRVHFRVRNGARIADRMLGELGYLSLTDIGFRIIGYSELTEKEWKTPPSGPFYLGHLHNKRELESMIGNVKNVPLHNPTRVIKGLALYMGEAEAPPFYYETDRISSYLKCSSPPLSRVIEALNLEGCRTVRTQFSPTGFKTEADEETVKRVYSTLPTSRPVRCAR